MPGPLEIPPRYVVREILRDVIEQEALHYAFYRASAMQRLALRRGESSDHVEHLADGRWVRIREARMPDGGRVQLTSDITRQRALQAELRQAEKLKAVGTLASAS